MPEFEIQLPPEIFTAIEPCVQRTMDAFEGRLVIDATVPSVEQDELIREAWIEELRSRLHEDWKWLRATLSEHFGKDGRLRLDSERTESLLRACSAVRLALRETELADLSDHVLETGEGLDIGTLPEPTEEALYAFSVLASLQELLVTVLDKAGEDQ